MITKRPFARPLFLWVIGILLYVFLPDGWLLGLLGGSGLLLMLALACGFRTEGHFLKYARRWLSGCVVATIVLILSVSVCYWRDGHPVQAFPRLQAEANRWQSECVERLDRLPLTNAERSVLATLTLGYRQAMQKETRRQFASAGVAHVLAVSGFHVAIVSGVLTLLLGGLRRWRWGGWVCYAVSLSGVWGFTFLTGLSPSAVRAAWMITLFLTGRQCVSGADSYNSLAAAAFCMLAYNPFYLFDVGFQLSFLAVYFLLAMGPLFRGIWEVHNPLIAYLWSGLWVALAAQLGTLGLILYYFGQCSLLFLWSSLPVTLAAVGLLPATWVWLCLPTGGFGEPFLREAIAWLTSGLTHFVERCAALPFATWSCSCDAVDVVAAYGILLIGLATMRLRWDRGLIYALAVGLLWLLKILICSFR